jgi:preprotein translocase subunit SecE
MKNVTQFFKEVRLELSKIVWPSTQELIGSLIIVLILVIAFALYLGVVDLIFYKIAEQLLAQ